MKINENYVIMMSLCERNWVLLGCSLLGFAHQDADELGAGNVEVPSWQIPDLVVRSLGKYSMLFS